MKYLFAALMFFSISPCFAELTLQDVDQFLANDNFEAAFKPSQTTIETRSCLGSLCDSPYNTVFVVKSLSAESAQIVGQKPNGTAISQQMITKSDWLAMNQNRVRYQIRSLESAGYRVRILSILKGSVTIAINGKKETIATLVVGLEAINALNMKKSVTLEVAPRLGGVGQLVTHSSGGDSFAVLAISN